MKKRRNSRKLLGRVRFASMAVAASVMPASLHAQQLLVDNITGNSLGYAGGFTFTGGAYILPGGTTQLTGFDMIALNKTTSTFSEIEINAYIWGAVNTTSAASSSTPAFSDLLGEYSGVVSVTGGFAPNYYLPIENYSSPGSSPGLTFGTPLNLPSGVTTIGITYNVQGEVTGGSTFASVSGLTSMESYGGPPAAGGEYTDFYINTGGETNGNFIEGPYSFTGLTDSSMATRIYGSAGTDSWNSNTGGAWETASNWSAGVPSAGTDCAFNLSSPAPGYTVSLNAADTCKDIFVQNDNVTLGVANVFALLTVSNAISVGNASTGSLTLQNNNQTAGSTPANFSAGSVYVGQNSGTGLLVVGSTVNLVSTGPVTIGAGSALNISGGKLFTPSLSLAGSAGAWTGKLDIGTGSLDLSSASLATVTSQAKFGYNAGTWNNSGGITSAAAASDTLHLTAVGVISNNVSGSALYGNNTLLGTFEGLSPGLNDVLVKYTYYGDCLLQGNVTGSDYSIVDNTYLNENFSHGVATNPISGWYNGDFNYDGVVDGSDYTLMDNAFNQQGTGFAEDIGLSTGNPAVTLQGAGTNLARNSISALAPGEGLPAQSVIATLDPQVANPTSLTGPGSPVPEPTSLGLLAVGSFGMLARRNRRRVNGDGAASI